MNNEIKSNRNYALSKRLNLVNVCKILDNYITDPSIPAEDRITIYRFIDKLSDTELFELKVNREFSAYKLKNKKDNIVECIKTRLPLKLVCGFELLPYKENLWELQLNGSTYVTSLTSELAYRVAMDINVAILIKNSKL